MLSEDSAKARQNTRAVKTVIFNADDFGARSETNRAIVRAHTEGILTSASLMVNEAGASEAAHIAHDMPTLAVGLHITLSDGLSALGGQRAPAIAGPDGRFRGDPAFAALRCFLNPRARRQAAAEIEEQFRRFAESGLSMDHVNGHQHIHVQPAIWRTVVRCAEQAGCHCIRLPREEFRPIPGEPGVRKVEWVFLRAMCYSCLRTLRGHGFLVADRVYGQLSTGNMNPPVMVDLLHRLGGEVNEIYAHPGTLHARKAPDDPSGMDVDLQGLLSPEVRRTVEEQHVQLSTYSAVYKRRQQPH